MLKFIGLSGTTGVTENMYIYEAGGDIIIVDCGIGFPESDMYGVDQIIPDFDYVKKNKDKIKAVLITHGHEDHIGALPYLMKTLRVPIYATKLAMAFIEDKFKEHRIKGVDLNIIDPEKDVISLGNFKVTPFRISHSIPDGVGFSIDTPEGNVFHVADYKFDWTPVVGDPFDMRRAASLSAGGVTALVSDSLGSLSPGYTRSEKVIESELDQIVSNEDKKVFFTTISSNISRMQQALNVAKKNGRKVAFVGKSIDKKAKIARQLGYLDMPKGLVISPKVLNKHKDSEIMFIIAGGYGQDNSALYRVATGEHSYIKLNSGDRVVFSANPAPPGTKESVDYLVDRLFEAGANVNFYDTQEDLHVSGHGSQEDIKTLFGLLRPKYFIPVGGTIRHNKGYKDIAVSMGAKEDDVFELSPGESVVFEGGKAKRGKRTPVKTVLVDGLGVGDVGNVVLRDRQLLSTEGVAIIHIQIDSADKKFIEDPEIISRGFVFEKESKDFLKDTAKLLREKIEEKGRYDKRTIKTFSADFLEKFFFQKTGRRPMILPVVVEV